MSSRLEFRLLGPLEVRFDGHPVDLGPARQRALLAVLLLNGNKVVSTDQLTDAVWGDAAPASVVNMIQVYVSRLRKVIVRQVLLTQPPGYMLRVGEEELDCARFEVLLASASEAMGAGEPDVARQRLGEAMALWRGPPLADFIYEPFAQAEVARLDELRLDAVELRVQADLALGRHVGLVAELKHLVAAHPFRERLRGQLMLALYRSGRQADALEAFRAARKTLVEELGLEPSPALRQIERAILAQDRELQPATPAPPPPVADGAGPNNLPPELTSLVGRDADIQQVADLLSQHRLVTLAGPGGVGKTRVAQRVASTLASGYEHGAWFADLAALDREGDVGGAALAALGLPDQPGSEALDTLAAGLRRRRLLLVLDNCEHVIGAAARAGARLLRDCPGVHILATSREPLAIEGERVQRLEPLATIAPDSREPAAVTLFLDRAAGHGVSWPQTARALDTVREVCTRLDGMPLAIELAAARVRAMPPPALLAHLDDRLRLLARPDHESGTNRQQTLEAAIAWSYDLLTEEEQAALRRLSVFHGGFSLSAAAAVCADIGDELDTVDRVTALVDRSVLSIQRRADGERYRLLESIGLFAERRLHEHGEDRGARDRHARFFLELAGVRSGRLHSAEQTASAARLAVERDNVTAALSWCLEDGGDPTVGGELAAAIGLDWTLRGRRNAAKRWLERALELDRRIAAPTQVAVHVARAILAYGAGDLDTALTHATRAAALARATGDQELVADAVAQLAFAHEALGHRDQASAAAAELRAMLPRLASPQSRVAALLASSHVALAAGDLERARADAVGAQRGARAAGDHLRAAMSGFLVAYAMALTAELPAARAAIADAEDDAARAGYQVLLADNLQAASSLALAAGDLETASRLLPRTLTMLGEQQRSEDFGRRLWVAALVELRRGTPEQAAILLGAALRRTSDLEFFDDLLLPDLASLPERLTAALGANAYEQAAARGASLGLDEVIAALRQ